MSEGFDTDFLGGDNSVPLPNLTGETAMQALNEGQQFPFMHFSIVMNKSRRFLIYGANNVDRNLMKEVTRGNSDWHFDLRIGQENQVGNELYRNNNWDRGHMVRRRDVCWGSMEEAVKGNYDSFCWANIVLQNAQINQGIWNEIEEWMLNNEDNVQNKLSIFTGPIFTGNDQEYCGTGQKPGCGIKIPAGFWKAMFYADSSNTLHSAAFIVKQDEFWTDNVGSTLENLESYQVPLRTVSDLTGIEFEDRLYQTNPLFYRSSSMTIRAGIAAPEFNKLRTASDLILKRKSI
ncbi:DNA/RNA non-specific endonuclease [Jeotgalibacillus sp. S-D1]|uniref:DNA/RNA non-specific endonuclease n=1 Tax=Jeotgalibacillus sp. S-D1 TaxID=2552189 RepID=UPI001F0F5B7D|nr:DNA/RNA non-specific endonuclease [Jeotgalibacillus sp. S-D1]